MPSDDTGKPTRRNRDEPAPRPEDRRGRRREPVYDLGEIRFAGSSLPVTCLVHNFSGSGALVEAATTQLPPRFILANLVRQYRAVCEIVWSNGRQLGVRFVTEPRHVG